MFFFYFIRLVEELLKVDVKLLLYVYIDIQEKYFLSARFYKFSWNYTHTHLCFCFTSDVVPVFVFYCNVQHCGAF